MARCTQIDFKQDRKMYDNQVALRLFLFSKYSGIQVKSPFLITVGTRKEEDCT